MSKTTDEDFGAGRSAEGNSNGQRSQSEEALTELRSSDRVENGTPWTMSRPDWDIDDDDDSGLKPSELFGKNTWNIKNFSEIKKRELRSDVFEVGGCKWYILIYPQGCEVNNYLSLFLCVENSDELLPGWNQIAQFTVALVNNEIRKSKHLDIIHRFWKKEHDWGWRKFIELPKLQDGFINDSGTLEVLCQVQLIRERVDRPFRCLDFQYRKDLVKTFLKNVEQTCSRFVEDNRSKLIRLMEDKARWRSFSAFWLGLDQSSRHRLSRAKKDVILKLVVGIFFVEKEYLSTLVIDSLFSGWKALEGETKSRPRLMDTEELPAPMVSVDKDMFVLVDDVLLLIERAASEPFPPKDEKAPQTHTKDGNAGEESSNEATERALRRLIELGTRTMERFVLAHIFLSKIEAAYQEAIAWIRQEELIREEEEAKREAAEKEKRKKQAKQKKNKNRGKEKEKEEEVKTQTEEMFIEKEESVRAKAVDQPSRHASDPIEICRIGQLDIVISNIQEPESNWEHVPVRKVHSAAILYPPRAAPAPLKIPSLGQAKREKKNVSNVDVVVPNKIEASARLPSSDQASPPSRDVQLQTVGSRAAAQKIASSKSAAQPIQSVSRRLSSPIIPPKQAAPVISAVQTSTSSFSCSMSSTGRLSYIPQSYKHAIVGSSGFTQSSSQSTETSTLPLYSHPPHVSVYYQSGFPTNVGSWDVSSGGFLWTGGSSSNRDTTTNHGTNPYNTPVTTRVRPTNAQFGRTAQSLITDEYPHLDIINDLLEDEYRWMDSSVYRIPQRFNNNQYTYHGGGADPGISGRSRSYNEGGFHQSYSEYMPYYSSSYSPYGNGQIDELVAQTQWQMATNMDLSLLAMRNQDDAALASASNYSYFNLDSSSNPNFSSGINGYFRPPNGY